MTKILSSRNSKKHSKNVIQWVDANNELRYTKRSSLSPQWQPNFDRRTGKITTCSICSPKFKQCRKRGYFGRGRMIGRGGYSGRGTGNDPKLIRQELVPLPHPWRNEVDDSLWDMQLDIMRQIKTVVTTAITSQIPELAISMETQIKTAIVADIST